MPKHSNLIVKDYLRKEHFSSFLCQTTYIVGVKWDPNCSQLEGLHPQLGIGLQSVNCLQSSQKDSAVRQLSIDTDKKLGFFSH